MTDSAAGGRRTAVAMACSIALGVALLVSAVPALEAQSPPPPSRVALVIGEGDYRGDPRPAAPDDAGLVAQVLAGAGFDVTGARDLDGDGMRRAFRDFLDKAGTAGPDGIAVVYLAGRAIQEDGDDFIVPVDARLARPSDIPIEAVRLADFTHALAALPIQAKVVIVDGAYAGGGPPSTGPASDAPGLALVEAERGELLAFNAAPGTVAPSTSGPYGAYAQALVGAIKQGGVPVGEVFARVRLAVNQATGGGVVPWDANQLTRSFTFFDRAPGAPAAASAQIPFSALLKRPLRDFPPDQAYDVALARDALPTYAEFLATFPDSPLARRVRLFQAVRREALFWRAALQGDTPGSFWTYLVRYPKGPHAPDARRRLTRLAASTAPPQHFAPLVFDVPSAPPGDVVFDRQLGFDVPDLPPPPPAPVFLLPPSVVVVLERPPPLPGRALLPVPVPVAIPFVRAPGPPGVIALPRGLKGDYPHPRPFARGPNGDGLVVETAPAATQGSSPDLSRSPAARPLPVSSPPPGAPGESEIRPPSLPQPVAPIVQPVPLPVSPAPQMPKVPPVPIGRPLAGPTMPVAPTPPQVPLSPTSPPTRPERPAVSEPAGATTPNPATSVRVPPPAPASVGRPVQGFPHAVGPSAVAPSPARRALSPPPAASPRSVPPAGPVRLAPAPRPLPLPFSPARPAPDVHRVAPERSLTSDRTQAHPAVPEGRIPGAAPGREPGHRPACGHPGEPPCRP